MATNKDDNIENEFDSFEIEEESFETQEAGEVSKTNTQEEENPFITTKKRLLDADKTPWDMLVERRSEKELKEILKERLKYRRDKLKKALKNISENS